MPIPPHPHRGHPLEIENLATLRTIRCENLGTGYRIPQNPASRDFISEPSPQPFSG